MNFIRSAVTRQRMPIRHRPGPSRSCRWLCHFTALSALLLLIPFGTARASIITNFTSVQYPGATNTVLYGVSGNTVVGSFGTHAFVYDGSTFTPLNGITARGIDGNNIVGSTVDQFGLAGYLYDGTTYTLLHDPLAANGFNANNQGTTATGISGNNIVGYYYDASKVAHGYLYSIAAGTYTTLDEPKAGHLIGGGTFAEGIDGNNIVGYYIDSHAFIHGFLFDGTTYTTLSGFAFGEGISGAYIVGNDSGGPPLGSAIYDGSSYTDVSNYNLYGISGNKIVGSYFTLTGINSGYYTGFIAMIPEPSSLLLAAMAAAGFALLPGLRRRLRR